jgi:crossover junction endodeoxyribonuclease RuvC
VRLTENARAAPTIDAARDPRIEQASRPLDFLNTSPGDGRQRRLVLGVDIGNRGAVAVLDETGEFVAVHDMPVLEDGPKGRRSVNPALLAEIVFKSHATKAFVEHVSARPGEGPIGAFAFGRAKGCVEGVLAAAGVPIAFLTPPQWKRLVGIPAGRDGAKDTARSEAIRRWPIDAGLFLRKRDDGRAEACLIALAGLIRERDQWRP